MRGGAGSDDAICTFGVAPLMMQGNLQHCLVACIPPPPQTMQAVRHGIAKALQFFDPAHRPELKSAGLLTRDARVVERKKPGRWAESPELMGQECALHAV